MFLRELHRMALSFIGLLLVPAGMLFAQQTEAERQPAKQPVAKSQNDVIRLFLGEKLPQRVLSESIGPHMLRLTSATYGNQLGIDIAELDGALRAQLGIEGDIGVLVTGVSSESEAAKSKLVQHDIILKIDEQPVSGTKQFNDLMGTLPGKTAQFHILRKAKPATVSVTLSKAPVYEFATEFVNIATVPETATLGVALNDLAVERHYRIGVTLAEADEVLRSQLRLATGEGLVVTDVLADSAAAKAGIQRHDVLTKLDGKRLTAVEAANAQIQEIKDRSVAIALYRAGNEVVLTVTPRLTDEPSYSGCPLFDRLMI